METVTTSQVLWLWAIESTLFIDFITHLLIFFGISLFVIFWKTAPQWHVTPLWYVGLSSLLISVSVALEWLFSPSFPMAYYAVGPILECIFDISLASLVVSFALVYYFKKKFKKKIDK